MARPRSNTAMLTREGHSVSLKGRANIYQYIFNEVLTSNASFEQYPLPQNTTAGIQREASLAFPSSSTDQDFILSTNLSLPPVFGSAYVGETFACSLCANNEIPTKHGEKSVSAVRIAAEMQTPSQTIPLQLFSSDDKEEDQVHSEPGSSIQRIIRFDLKEEGNHVLAVNVTYSETTHDSSGTTPVGGRVRSFRKLYQFLAQPCLNVRTKATELVPTEVPDKSLGPYGRASLLRYALEAQLENVSESRIVLEQAVLKSMPPFKSTSLNWDAGDNLEGAEEVTALNPRDVVQIAFIVEQEPGVTTGLDDLKANLRRDGRTILGQIGIQWRGTMGEKGSLSTGNLLTRKKQ